MRKHALEYGLFRLVTGLVRCLPERVVVWAVGHLAWSLQEWGGWRKAETLARMRQVFPEKDERALRRLRRAALRNLGRNVVELIDPPADLDARVTGMPETFEAFRQARERGKGILLVIVHSGNWDLAGVRTAHEGFPLCFIARKQKNSRLYDALIRAREEGGGAVLDRDDPKLIRKVLGFLAENGVVAILVDIRARQPGQPYSFLGQDAWLSNGLGLLAAKSGAEVVPVFLGREDGGRQIWKPFPARRLESGHGREEREVLLQGCLDDLGSEVLRRPESYFWFNKRWVLQPKEDA